jgi:hypothetical protein
LPVRLAPIVLLFLLASAGRAAAQILPAGPVRAQDGKIRVSGEVVATASDSDEIAYFNYTDYEHNALRMLRLSVSGAWQPASRLAFVGELRTEDLEHPRAYAAYVRIRPWTDRDFDIQAGRIPPAFGAFSRRAYTSDNPVIGYPLAYQYLTAIRPDAVPATPTDLLRMRARGWLSSYPVGDPSAAPGVPLVSAFRWDTGVQAHVAAGFLEATASVTSGTLSDPRAGDNNGSPQVSGRVAAQPVAGLVLGASAAHGAWLSTDVVNVLPETASHPGFAQTAFGADAEYSRDHWLVRTEMVWSRWRVPFALTAPGGLDLDSLGIWVEGQYKITPRFFTGFRADHLGFSNLPGVSADVPWDAPVNRIEASLGYKIQRNLTARAGVQRNDRDAGRVHRRTYFSAQLAYWF